MKTFTNETKFMPSRIGIFLGKGRSQNCAISGLVDSKQRVRKVTRILYSSEVTATTGRVAMIRRGVAV